MISPQERSLLYWLAREYTSGAGAIVDAGCFLGASTAALAAGLRDCPRNSRTRPLIFSYDRFEAEPYMIEAGWFPDLQAGDSFRARFEATARAFDAPVTVCAGDILTHGWEGGPIEILFLDILKTSEINDHVAREFLPHLIPGRSVIIQQDYAWGELPWIHVTMERLASSLPIVDWLPWSSTVHAMTRPLPSGFLGTGYGDLDADEKLKLMDGAIARWSGEERGRLECSKAALLLELEGWDAARDQLEVVRAAYPRSEVIEVCASNIEAYGRPELDTVRAELDTVRVELECRSADLAQAGAEIDQARVELERRHDELGAAMKAREHAERELASTDATLRALQSSRLMRSTQPLRRLYYRLRGTR